MTPFKIPTAEVPAKVLNRLGYDEYDEPLVYGVEIKGEKLYGITKAQFEELESEYF